MIQEPRVDPARIRRTVTSLAVLAVAGVILALMAVLVGSGEKSSEALAIGVLVVVVGSAIVLVHPRWVYCSLAFILGAIPMATVPGVGTPVVLVLAFAAWCAVVTHRIAETRTSKMELAVGTLVVASLASLVMTVAGLRDVAEFVKWLVATSLVFALLRLSRSDLHLFGRVFAWGAFCGAAVSLVMRFLDDGKVIVGKLAFVGIADIGDGGGFPRLRGTYVEPNSAGIFLLIALAIAVALLRGWQRLVVAPVILLALICTLSRSAMLSVLVAVVFLLVFQRMATRRRIAIASALTIGCITALTVPMIYNRFTGTFKDRGSLDREASLAEYTRNMTDSWWFGKGWGRPEFISDADGFVNNHVANSPLLSIYRGGLFVGIAFVVVLVIGCVVAYRNVYVPPWEAGVIGAVFFGFTVVALQLDFPVVTHAPVTMGFSVLIVFLIANPVTKTLPEKHSRVTAGRHRSTADV